MNQELGAVVLLATLLQSVSITKEEDIRRQGRSQSKTRNVDARYRRQKPITQTVRQRTEPYHREDNNAIPSQHLSQSHESFIPSHKSIHIRSQHTPARQKRSGGASHGCDGSDRPAQGEPIDEA